jgi:Ca-activated chloride channel family protein
MRKAIPFFLLVGAAAVGAAVVVALTSCSSPSHRGAAKSYAEYYYSPESRSAAQKAHGGTHNVNDAAYDAMFFRNYGVNPFVDADEDHLSTFAVDVDTGSYTLCRAYLEGGHVPPKDAVRVEEFVNYFDYGYAPPGTESEAFAVHLEAAPSKWSAGRLLLRVGLKAREIQPAARKNAVLTFVIDTSGSMGCENRLELVKKALRLLVDQLRESDAVGLAVYGTTGRKLLDHRPVQERQEILRAIERLRPEGSTNAEEGLVIGYRMARAAFREGAINRVIVCSDGVANVGNTGPESILRSIQEEAAAGITLSTIGFGMGNYNDVLMEQLADKGRGNYAYVDTLDEAKRVFVQNLTGLLQVVARDAKVQVDFNALAVRSYRLLGYENRDVADQDFRNDKVDGGQIGAGHAVTALYELKLWPGRSGRLATVQVRYKEPEGEAAREVSREVDLSQVAPSFEAASGAFRLAACVAQFAEILRESYWARGSNMDEVLALARLCQTERGRDEQVNELVGLITKARDLGAGGQKTAGSSSLEE